MCFTVNKLGNPGQPKVECFEKTNVAHISVVKAHREISIRIPKLPQGTYVIVPSTKSPG